MTADAMLDENVELKIEEGVTVVDTKSGELYTVGAVLDDGSVVCIGVRDRKSCALLPMSLSVVKPALQWEPVGDPTPQGSGEEQASTGEAPATEPATTPESTQESVQEPTGDDDSSSETDETSSETDAPENDVGDAPTPPPTGTPRFDGDTPPAT